MILLLEQRLILHLLFITINIITAGVVCCARSSATASSSSSQPSAGCSGPSPTTTSSTASSSPSTTTPLAPYQTPSPPSPSLPPTVAPSLTPSATVCPSLTPSATVCPSLTPSAHVCPWLTPSLLSVLVCGCVVWVGGCLPGVCSWGSPWWQRCLFRWFVVWWVWEDCRLLWVLVVSWSQWGWVFWIGYYFIGWGSWGFVWGILYLRCHLFYCCLDLAPKGRGGYYPTRVVSWRVSCCSLVGESWVCWCVVWRVVLFQYGYWIGLSDEAHSEMVSWTQWTLSVCYDLPKWTREAVPTIPKAIFAVSYYSRTVILVTAVFQLFRGWVVVCYRLYLVLLCPSRRVFSGVSLVLCFWGWVIRWSWITGVVWSSVSGGWTSRRELVVFRGTPSDWEQYGPLGTS